MDLLQQKTIVRDVIRFQPLVRVRDLQQSFLIHVGKQELGRRLGLAFGNGLPTGPVYFSFRPRFMPLTVMLNSPTFHLRIVKPLILELLSHWAIFGAGLRLARLWLAGDTGAIR